MKKSIFNALLYIDKCIYKQTQNYLNISYSTNVKLRLYQIFTFSLRTDNFFIYITLKSLLYNIPIYSLCYVTELFILYSSRVYRIDCSTLRAVTEIFIKHIQRYVRNLYFRGLFYKYILFIVIIRPSLAFCVRKIEIGAVLQLPTI